MFKKIIITWHTEKLIVMVDEQNGKKLHENYFKCTIYHFTIQKVNTRAHFIEQWIHKFPETIRQKLHI